MKIPLPGLKKRIGAGTAVKQVAEAVGIKQKEGCGCKERQERLDRRAEFIGWKEWRNS